MGLTELFNEWIIERGSAKVQEKHIALFRDQLAMADKKVALLEKENEKLKTDLQESQTENKILRSKIQEYEQQIQQSNNNKLIDDVKVKILLHLSDHEKSLIPQIVQAMGIKTESAKYHLRELKTQRLIKDGFTRDKYGSVNMNYSLDQEGRRLLIEQGLLT